MEKYQASRGLSGIAELLVYTCVHQFYVLVSVYISFTFSVFPSGFLWLKGKSKAENLYSALRCVIYKQLLKHSGIDQTV